SWPTDVLRPTTSLQARLARRIAEETGKEPVLPPARSGKQAWSEPEWEEVAPRIECKLRATDTERHRVSMLVRLAPGASYRAPTHGGVEELPLLDGELWIDEKKLVPGDYNYGAPGAGDERVWSETGCTCVLVTSTEEILTRRDSSHEHVPSAAACARRPPACAAARTAEVLFLPPPAAPDQ